MGGKKKVTTGYQYGLGTQSAICYGPVDEISSIDVDNRQAWAGSITTSGATTIDAPNLFGGLKREGGIKGKLTVWMGDDNQQPDPYLQEQLGANVPAFLGVLTAVYRGIVSANNPYLKPWAFTVKRILAGWRGGVWYPEKAAIGDNMNPAHIVYQTHTDTDWGMGYPSGSINDANFRAVADQLHAEGFGLSMIWNQSGTIQSFQGIVMEHIGGVLRTNPQTGLFEIKLIRSDYTPAQLLNLNPGNSVLESFERPAISETVNEVTIIYTDGATGKETALTVHNLANIQAQGGVVPKSINLTGITSAAIAARVAERELTALSTPLAKVRVTVNREAWAVLPGDVVTVTWPKYGLDLVPFRVAKVGVGDLDDGRITLEAAEDVFGLPAASYVEQEPVGWVNPSQAPAAAPQRLIYEAPYAELAATLDPANLAALDPSDCFLWASSRRPNGMATDGTLWTKPSGGTYADAGAAPHCPTAILSGNLAAEAGPSTFAFVSGYDLDQVEVGGFIVIDQEHLRLDAIDVDAGTITAGRGVHDTVPAAHTSGAVIFFADGFAGGDDTAYASGSTIYAKIQTRTGEGDLDLALAPEDSLVMAGRQARPYPPGQFKIGGQYYPAIAEGDLVITWAHRDRTLQADQLIDAAAASIGPEASTSYSVRLLRADTLAVLTSQTGITGTSATLSATYDGQVVVELWSDRGGLASLQKHQHAISYLRPLLAPTSLASTYQE